MWSVIVRPRIPIIKQVYVAVLTSQIKADELKELNISKGKN